MTAVTRTALLRAALAAVVALLALRSAAAADALEAAESDFADAPAFAERSFHVLHVPFLFFGAADPASGTPGRFTLSVETAYASTFSSTWHATTFHRIFGLVGKPFTPAEADAIHRDDPGDAVFYVESDLLRIAATPRLFLAPEWSVSAEIVYLSHDAIHGGSAIESFHRIFGTNQTGRTEFPSDAFAVVLQRPNHEITFDDRVPDSGFGDTTGTLSWRPRAASAWSFGGDLAVKAPTGRAADFNGSGSWDAGILGFARRQGARWMLDAEAGYVVPGRWKAATDMPVTSFGRVLVAATRSFGARTRIGASATYEQSPFRRDSMGDLSRAGLEFALGIERDFRRSSVRLTLTENTPGLGDRADFGIALRIRYR